MHIPITGLLRSIPASEYTVNRKGILGIQHQHVILITWLNFAVLYSQKSIQSLVYSPEETIFDLRSIRAWLNNEWWQTNKQQGLFLQNKKQSFQDINTHK